MNQKRKKVLTTVIMAFLLCNLFPGTNLYAQAFFNLDFEYKQNEEFPINWTPMLMSAQLDSINKVNGKYSIQMERTLQDSIYPYGLIVQHVLNRIHSKAKKSLFHPN